MDQRPSILVPAVSTGGTFLACFTLMMFIGQQSQVGLILIVLFGAAAAVFAATTNWVVYVNRLVRYEIDRRLGQERTAIP